MKIYKITNCINGKVYIGQTSRSIERRWKEHCCPSEQCPLLKKAIQKYGKENFSIVQIDSAIDREEANAKEKHWIAFYDSANSEKGYNLSLGGGIGDFNDATLHKMSESHKGEKNHFFGKHHTEESRKKMSLLKRGKSMTIEEKIKQTETAISKTKVPYAKRDFEKYLKRLKAQKYKK